MGPNDLKRNERDWAGQLISWLKAIIDKRQTIFQDATNDTSIRMASGRTKYPDILLFTDKTSGIIFNGWELKFPDTSVDDREMLENALEKAKRISSDSFVTWNGAQAIIWKIDTSKYTVDSLTIIKDYPKVPTINNRTDLSIKANFDRHEAILRQQASDILHDLEQLYLSGIIRPAINVSDNLISAIQEANDVIVPQFAKAIEEKSGRDKEFRWEFNQWKMREHATLDILSTSSRKVEKVDSQTVLAKFTFYNLIGKILFYLTLSENLSGCLRQLSVSEGKIKEELSSFFDDAKSIDYQAIFQPYFTDSLEYSPIVEAYLYRLIKTLTSFDFKILPSEVIGTILENIVPDSEQQKFGQYFTSPVLAHMVAFPAVSTNSSILFDPTSGTGTFLNAFYNILSYLGNSSHQGKLTQIWGNDISHFPALLSVINLYKQDVSESNNFPRVLRKDFFTLNIGETVGFPSPKDYSTKVNVPIPMFDGIASNFPFIQQEDIPTNELTDILKSHFKAEDQPTLFNGNRLTINKRSDYFAYCIYNASHFLNQGGVMSVITSNAWLGKEYGTQLKSFLLDNFHIKYIVRSKAEHWFSTSEVTTIFFVLEKGAASNKPTRFVTLNFKLNDYFNKPSKSENISLIEDLYARIDYCQGQGNDIWIQDSAYAEHFVSADRLVDVTIIPRKTLTESLRNGINWAQYFIAENPLKDFDQHLIPYEGKVASVSRGVRTGWNDMFVIPEKKVAESGISNEYLQPYLKSSKELTSILHTSDFKYRLFVCDKDLHSVDQGTRNWVNRFVNQYNQNGTATIPETCQANNPFWYSLSPHKVQIVTAINPNERLFFAYSEKPFIIDQRLIALELYDPLDVEIVAAILNSISSLLTIELRGTSRHLGALDLNANFLKGMRFLDPSKISANSKAKILSAFEPLKKRSIGSIDQELIQKDRKQFDEIVMEAFGIDKNILPSLYKLMKELVTDRISMKHK